MRIRIQDLFDRDPEGKNSDPGSGINILDPPHCTENIRYSIVQPFRVSVSLGLRSTSTNSFSNVIENEISLKMCLKQKAERTLDCFRHLTGQISRYIIKFIVMNSFKRDLQIYTTFDPLLLSRDNNTLQYRHTFVKCSPCTLHILNKGPIGWKDTTHSKFESQTGLVQYQRMKLFLSERIIFLFMRGSYSFSERITFPFREDLLSFPR